MKVMVEIYKDVRYTRLVEVEATSVDAAIEAVTRNLHVFTAEAYGWGPDDQATNDATNLRDGIEDAYAL